MTGGKKIVAENGTQPLTGATLRALAARIDADTRRCDHDTALTVIRYAIVQQATGGRP